jgi:hypothetical protein
MSNIKISRPRPYVTLVEYDGRETREVTRVDERGDVLAPVRRDPVDAELAQRRQHVGNRFCGEWFQRVGNVPRGRPVKAKLLHVVEHTKKVHPVYFALLIVPCVDRRGEAKVSHA